MSALASTLLHFLWQGALAAALLAVADLLLARSAARYAAACAALGLMVTACVATYVALSSRPPAPADAGAASLAPADAGASASAAMAASAAPLPIVARLPRLPASGERAVVLGWLAGVALLALRLLGGWAAAQDLARRRVAPAPEPWPGRLERLALRLRVSRPVRLLASRLVGAPSALGILSPVILVPASAFTAIPAPELEAILAHELAHIRRHDFLVNLLQSAAETLLFYHPAVWWVSHRIRVERENACDDLAVRATGDAALYARALVELEEARQTGPSLAVAARGGSLFLRVTRLVAPTPGHAGRLAPSLAAILALSAAGVLGAAARVAPAAADAAPALISVAPEEPETAVTPVPSPEPGAPTPGAAKPGRARTSLPAARAAAVTPATGPQASASASLPTPGQLIAFRIHGVTPELVEELHALGYTHVNADELVAMRIHGVTPDYIRSMNRRFQQRLPVAELIEARIHGVQGDDQ